MAAIDSQKQLFTLIRDFATEKSQGEKRVINLKNRINELQSEVETAWAELENAKRFKETTEQELKGYEVELSMCETSIQTIETRIGSIQDEISKIGSDVDALKVIYIHFLPALCFGNPGWMSNVIAMHVDFGVDIVLKNKEAALRDEFISQMLAFNSEIRKFQDSSSSNLHQKSGSRKSSDFPLSADWDHLGGEDVEIFPEKKICVVVVQSAAEEEECVKEQNLHNKLHQELVDSRRRLKLIKGIMNDIKELQDLTRLTSELEEKCALSSEELQQRCLCPNCHLDNSEALAELLQGNGE